MIANLRKLSLRPEQCASLGSLLAERLKWSPCDHTLRHTKEWILANGAARHVRRIVKGLEDKGGFCDCEVLHNVIPLEATVERPRQGS
jgi:hypothetical protein